DRGALIDSRRPWHAPATRTGATRYRAVAVGAGLRRLRLGSTAAHGARPWRGGFGEGGSALSSSSRDFMGLGDDMKKVLTPFFVSALVFIFGGTALAGATTTTFHFSTLTDAIPVSC